MASTTKTHRGTAVGHARGAALALVALAALAVSAACGSGGAPATPAAAGKALAEKVGCTACHSGDGLPGVGPSFKGLVGRQVTLADGSLVTADEAYLRESITNPGAKLVKGFAAGVMPQTFQSSLTPEQLSELVEYIKSLQ